MINRINLILKAKNITARQFAEEIGIQPSGMSHILSGRNNPSLDFVSKVIRRYPEIDSNWLLLGRGEMYMTGTPAPATSVSPSPSAQEPTLFSMPDPQVQQTVVETPAPSVETQRAASPTPQAASPTPQAQQTNVETPSPYVETPQAASSIPQSHPTVVEREDKKPSPSMGNERRLVKILMFYDDHSFEEYRPQ